MLNELDWGVLGRQQEYDAKVTLNEKINEIIKKINEMEERLNANTKTS